MSLTKALGDSNAAPKTSNMDESTGASDVGMQGYTAVPFPSQKPAQSNADVGITKDNSFNKANEGTSISSYKQPKTVSAKSGS